eukprot:7390218-Karenia_brevis.AAC.1
MLTRISHCNAMEVDAHLPWLHRVVGKEDGEVFLRLRQLEEGAEDQNIEARILDAKVAAIERASSEQSRS